MSIQGEIWNKNKFNLEEVPAKLSRYDSRKLIQGTKTGKVRRNKNNELNTSSKYLSSAEISKKISEIKRSLLDWERYILGQ